MKPSEPSKSVAESLEANLRNWLSTEGYPVELRSAAAFRAGGFHVRQGHHFRDPETGKSREIDLICSVDDFLGVASIRIITECKASRNPWIVFTSDHVLRNYNRFFAFAILSDSAREFLVSEFMKSHQGSVAGSLQGLAATYHGDEDIRGPFSRLTWFKKKQRTAYAATVAFSKDGGDPTYNAAMQVLKASLHDDLERNLTYRPPLRITFPLIVLDAPLFECWLGEDEEIQLAQVPECDLLFMGRVGNAQPGTCVRIVTFQALENFVALAMQEIKELQEILKPAIAREWEALRSKTEESS